jgi:organic radical activating enzyme
MSERNYYCNLKFRFLKIDLDSFSTYNCHASEPHPVDFEWLSNNPLNLFNTDINVAEREMMLKNERNNSCEQNCWHIEDRNGTSPRMYQYGEKITHTDVRTAPEIIDLTVGSHCNLTCSYCSKVYSTAWRKDIANNGNYTFTESDEISREKDRYTLDLADQISLKVKQADIKQSQRYTSLLNEIIEVSPSLKHLIITGGEPFNDNTLFDTIAQVQMSPSSLIEIYTGLGINYNRFVKCVEQIKRIKGPDVRLRISVESTKEILEFTRYGIKWLEFLKKIEYLKTQNVNFLFHCTLNNLSIFGFKDFYEKFKENEMKVTFAYTPRCMSLYVLDDISKEQIKKDIQSLDMPIETKEQILSSLAPEPSKMQRIHIKEFLTEFVKRRDDISLDIFPKSFLKWMG